MQIDSILIELQKWLMAVQSAPEMPQPGECVSEAVRGSLFLHLVAGQHRNRAEPVGTHGAIDSRLLPHSGFLTFRNSTDYWIQLVGRRPGAMEFLRSVTSSERTAYADRVEKEPRPARPPTRTSYNPRTRRGVGSESPVLEQVGGLAESGSRQVCLAPCTPARSMRPQREHGVSCARRKCLAARNRYWQDARRAGA